jgi:hypothetical protein
MKPYDLTTILTNLFDHAQILPGHEVKHRFTNGLVITMIVSQFVLNLSLSRRSVYPSITEWWTVLQHMPFPCSVHSHIKEPNTLTALIPIHPKLL